MLLVLIASALGCMRSDDGTGSPSGQGENITKATQFVVWLPANDPLVTEHTRWHIADGSHCGDPGTRQCPLSGQEFFMFHRNYMHRLRAKFNSLGRTEDITPWYSLPPEMHDPRNGWTTALANAESNIFNNYDPSTNSTFASLEAYGTYVEGQYHNYLHGIAANAYGENAIAPINMSPTSTYFFKIHGLIEYLFDSFQRGDFNHDGHTDIIQRNSVDPGDLYLSWMNGPNLISNRFVANVAHDGCDWQPVAAADMNFDGDNDIIWRGAGCSGISIWYMDGDANMIGFVDSWSGLPTVDGDWTIVGTGDFNGDLRPDIVWQSLSTRQISIWYMDASCSGRTCTPQYGSSSTVSFSDDEIDAIGVADFDRDGYSDVVMRSGTPDAWSRKINYFNGGAIVNSRTISETFDSSLLPVALGHFTGNIGFWFIYNADMVWAPPADGGDWVHSEWGINEADGSLFWYQSSVPTTEWNTYVVTGPH